MRTADHVAVECCPLRAGRLRMNHLDDVRKRWALPGAGAEQSILVTAGEPLANQPLRGGTQRLPANDSRPKDLDVRPQHARIVDHTSKYELVQPGITRRQPGAQQRRCILHERVGPAVDGHTCDELRTTLINYGFAQLENSRQLLAGSRIEGPSEAAR